MSITNLKYIAFIVACILIASCEKDVSVDLPDYPTQLVLFSNNTVYKNGGEAISATAGKSISILQYNGRQELVVPNAKIEIYSEGKLLATMVHDPIEEKYYSSVIPQEGKTYTLKASAPGFDNTAEATAKAINQIPITNITHTPNARNSSNGPEDEVTITFNDPQGETNYYMISFHSPGTDDLTRQYYSYLCVNTLDPSIETIEEQDFEIFNDENSCLYGDLFMKDELFNGQTKQVKFYINSYGIQSFQTYTGDTLYSSVVLTHVSEDYYRYRKTAAAASTNQGNPFAEPSNVHSNITNGRGIFSISAPHILQIKP